jgi:ribonuclease BN (tRNA processing enzyme)
VRVLAAPGISDHLLQEPDGVLELEEISESEKATVGGIQLSFSRTDHPPPTFAVRIEGAGRVLGYSADTGAEWSFKALGPGINLALSEATYTREHEGTAGHMSGHQAGKSAREAGADRLLITHFSPVVSSDAIYAEAVETYGGPVLRAAVGRGYTV